MAASKTDTMTCWERKFTSLDSLFSLHLQNSAVVRDVSKENAKKIGSLHHNTDAEALKTQDRFQRWTTTAVVVQRLVERQHFTKCIAPPWHPTVKYLNMRRQMCSISCISILPAIKSDSSTHLCLVKMTWAAHDSSNLNMMHLPLHRVAETIRSALPHILNYFIRNQMPVYREKMSCEMHLTWSYTCFILF